MNWNAIKNAAYLAIDQPAISAKNRIALYWQGENGEKEKYTFEEIKVLANQFAHFLKNQGVNKGDRVFFFLPRIPLIYFGFLGTLKTGAIAGTFFSAFGTQALLDRLNNSEAKILLTTKTFYPRLTPILKKVKSLQKVILINKKFLADLKKYPSEFANEPMRANEPAFMLYTSATGNTPVSGIVIPHQAIIQHLRTAKIVLDLKKKDIYWCTGDPGWITGVAYGIMAPWACQATQLVYEGRFKADIWLKLIADYHISVIYTAPTALRMLQRETVLLKKINLSSLRHIACIGEALSPDLISWSKKYLNRPVYDTYWQTETGAIMIANHPGLKIKPGSMGKTLPGIKAGIMDDRGALRTTGEKGNLVFKIGWPAMMVKIWKNNRLYKSYFKNGWFITGDRAYQDKDGYFWFVGRKSEIIKTAGERVGTFEVESVLNSHPAVLESAIIGKPDFVRGEIIKAFVQLKKPYQPSKSLITKLQNHVKAELAGHAYPREIEFVEKLPINKSGKIMRRLLKAKELGLPTGDISTLEEN